jgi:hypothetical protein
LAAGKYNLIPTLPTLARDQQFVLGKTTKKLGICHGNLKKKKKSETARVARCVGDETPPWVHGFLSETWSPHDASCPNTGTLKDDGHQYLTSRLGLNMSGISQSDASIHFSTPHSQLTQGSTLTRHVGATCWAALTSARSVVLVLPPSLRRLHPCHVDMQIVRASCISISEVALSNGDMMRIQPTLYQPTLCPPLAMRDIQAPGWRYLLFLLGFFTNYKGTGHFKAMYFMTLGGSSRTATCGRWDRGAHAISDAVRSMRFAFNGSFSSRPTFASNDQH